jgi:hypothetical protein
VRIKSTWFKSGRQHTPDELAGALSFVIYKMGDNSLKNTRKANFEIAVGAQYFAFLSEFLLFLIQISDRIAYRKLSEEDRFAFTSSLTNRVAETHAENESRLLGRQRDECKRQFIDQFNLRAGEYAEFTYGENGPDFSFFRYLGYCIDQVMDEKDNGWIIDQMMSIEAPEAVDMIEKTFRNLLETEPRQTRRKAAVGGE